MIVVVKIGTSSVTAPDGTINIGAIEKLAREISGARQLGHEVIVVSSGAVTAGVATIWPGRDRPVDPVTLQAMASIGQHRLMAVYNEAFSSYGLSCGQVLLTPANFGERRSYLRAQETLRRLLELGVVPIINENDPLADDEIRFGDNDRLAALLANLIGAELLTVLTDTEGLFDADPRYVEGASLVAEVTAIDAALENAAGGPGTPGGSGGMASKLAAAHMASRSGVRTVIAAARRPEVVHDAIAGDPQVGTVIHPTVNRLSARKLWIAFARPSSGSVVVDNGARGALIDNEASLLPAGVRSVSGEFSEDDAIEIRGMDGKVFAKGISRLSASRAEEWVGRRLSDLPPDIAHELIHRDDLVVLI